MSRARVLVGGAAGLGVALLLWGGLFANDEAVPLARADPPALTRGVPAGSSLPPPVLEGWSAAPLPAAAPVMTWHKARAGFVVPITVVLPQKLRVGETGELVVGLGSNVGVGEISFTVHFDADVLQVRAGTEGDWAAGVGGNARFTAEISAAEDRVQVRSAASGARRLGAAASVALVQFQAVAPGTTSVRVSDVTVRDLAGQPMPFSLALSNVQVTAESLPPPGPEAARPRGPPAIEAPAPEAADSGG